jgi:hypothetical protein
MRASHHGIQRRQEAVWVVGLWEGYSSVGEVHTRMHAASAIGVCRWRERSICTPHRRAHHTTPHHTTPHHTTPHHTTPHHTLHVAWSSAQDK